MIIHEIRRKKEQPIAWLLRMARLACQAKGSSFVVNTLEVSRFSANVLSHSEYK